MLCEMHEASFRNWTRAIDFIFYDDNDYVMIAEF